MLIARDVNGPLSSLLKQFDAAVAKNKDAELRSFAVFLTDAPQATEKTLQEFAEKHKISENVPLTIVEGVAGPPSYKIDKDADVSVLLYKANKVVSSFAFKAGELKEKDVKAIVAQLPKILPTEEELKAKREADAKLQRELDELKKKLDDAKAKSKTKNN